ncbi:bile acid:sodium symporter family protein [Reinekea marinisedimentorum]|uniref:BASS family bile acid:Na+ symporter n=1 Tax=Reinekea marinisedimentorum TaxID=230495 RepID=A0A4R3HZS5_9GAMM|nr:bile acid:sodium symporter family protein [Reinekea marinisedimentorum]TCS38906.1 BASS family bile acid:Na+ symporter [Reinekea marinisedimentorum]
MQQLVSQVLLPVVLATIMLGMGLGLTPKDFKRVVTQPKAVLLGFCLQVLFLPALALVLIAVLPLSPVAAAGLFLVSLCPGGATSNLFSYIAHGDVALSVTLTGIISLLSPVLLPVAFISFLSITGDTAGAFTVPLATIIKQLAVVTLVPVTIGMTIRAVAPVWSEGAQPLVKKISTIAMVLIVFMLMATNMKVMQSIFSINALAVLLLATVSLLAAHVIAGAFKLPAQSQRTVAIEVGVQNAGTAMMVALAILHKPELAFVPLMYGLFMNIPAFAFVAWVQKKNVAQAAAIAD